MEVCSVIYRWKSGSRHSCDAGTAGEVCERLASEGRLTPRELVDESRPEDAPLHGEFEWDDAIAAEAYRESQARYVIRSIEVTAESGDATPTRAFVAMQDGGPCEYTPIMVVMEDDRRREALLEKALGELAAFRLKYESLTELAHVFEAIDQLQLAM